MPTPRAFPIDAELPGILASLAGHPRLVLEAPPGAGKTTQVPLALLGADWRGDGRILMLEPRRIAARAAAGFMASQLAESIGERVGYRIRFENRVSAATRIEVLTEGILTRMLQVDPLLDGVAVLIFDEFHERHLASDLGLALALDVQASVRPDLRIVVMSATLDGERLAGFLDAPRIRAEGRSFPVAIRHFPARAGEALAFQLRRAVQQALAESSGDVLCFLPGKAEIASAERALAGLDVELAALHGELGIAEQARLLGGERDDPERRRVVLATNVAESSVTLPAVTAVVDSGLAREPVFDPASGMSRLETLRITQSSASQRAGRAGRVAAGLCLRLWPQSERLEPATRAEMLRVDLAPLLLELKAWGSEQLRFPDPPPTGAMAAALDLLRALDALDDDDGRLSAHGRQLLSLGAHPRLANAMRRAPPPLVGLACDLAALIEARDPLRGPARFNDDMAPRLAALQGFRQGRTDREQSDRQALALIDQAGRQWRRRLGIGQDVNPPDLPPHAIGNVLALAWPDRIARQDPGNPRRYQLANGRGARLREDSALYGEPWLAIAELRFEERDSLIQRAATVDLRFLEQAFAGHFSRQRRLQFNPETAAVETWEEQRFAELLLERRALPTARDPATDAILVAGIRKLGVAALPWTEALREWQSRVLCLRAWCPELGLPDVGDQCLLADLDQWFAPLLSGCARLAELKPETFAAALHGLLDYAQQQALDRYAPRELAVPSGMRRKLLYQVGQPPVLAVKLQELFGLADTPRIGKDRVAVLLHLLSPRQTPIQVTQDLKGFWERTYPEVKKELAGRYPKHPWPDDPWTATATHRAKPRR
ncbi:MAG: ATP-dependent helicase HrpB [Lysobacterales bacterium]